MLNLLYLFFLTRIFVPRSLPKLKEPNLLFVSLSIKCV